MPEGIDAALARARRDEAARLQRFRLWWIARHVGLVLVSCAVIFESRPQDPTVGKALVGVLSGSFIGLILAFGLVWVCALAIPFALFRLVTILRSDDLAEFERRHRGSGGEA